MKKHLIKSMALAMAFTMSMSTVAFATGAVTVTTDKTVAATSKLDAAVYSILLPTTIAVVTNPLGIGGNPQVYTTPLTVANKSNVAVLVTTKVQAVVPTTAVAPATPPILTAYGKVNTFNKDNKDKQFSLIAQPIKKLAVVPSTTPPGDAIPGDYTGKMRVGTALVAAASAANNNLKLGDTTNYVATTNVWQLAADGSSLSKGHYAVVGTDPATDTNDLSANLEFLLNGYNAAATVNFGDSNIHDQAAGFILSGELNPFATWAANDIKANVTFKIAALPTAITSVLNSAKTDAIAKDALNVVGIKHAKSATDTTKTTALTVLPVVTSTAHEAAKTKAQMALATDVTLNKLEGTWTVDAVNAKILNTGTGRKTGTGAGDYPAFTAADITYTAAAGATPAKITFVAAKLLSSATAGILKDDYSTAGTYQIAVPMKNAAAGIETTIFVNLTYNAQ